MAKNKLLQLLWLATGILFLDPPATQGAEKIVAAPKWQRFELTFKSSVTYPNPWQEAEMRVLFVSPRGETNRVYGFWDGGKTWRVRFQPDFPGRWTYHTMCSDTANQGLHEQSGAFLCTAGKEESQFDRHGPIQVARTQQHLEHADRTPFLWLGDAAWQAGIKANRADWLEYVQTRAKQKFNVVQWRLNADTGDSKQTAFQGRDHLSLNLEVLRQLDAKIATANRAGLLCAIAPLWEIGMVAEERCPDEQAIRLMRYAVARWGAENVAWIVAFEADSSGEAAARWLKIGRAVFNHVTHAPVVLLPGESVWVFDGFRNERWVDVLGVQSTSATNEATLPWWLRGPLNQERAKTPLRPIITISPPAETGAAVQDQANPELIRQMLWWSFLLNTPAGTSYAHHNVSEWNHSDPASRESSWRQALSSPGASFVAPFAACFAGREFWKLEALAAAKSQQANLATAQKQIVGAATADRQMSLIYAPEECAIELVTEKHHPRARTTWFNPRTGESRLAVARQVEAGLFYSTPEAGDWVLVVERAAGPGKMAEAKKTAPKIDKGQRH